MILRLPMGAQKDKMLALNEAFFRLSRNQDFKTVVEWLKLEKLRLSLEIARAEGVHVPWSQGALQALYDVLLYSDSDEATKIIEKLKK